MKNITVQTIQPAQFPVSILPGNLPKPVRNYHGELVVFCKGQTVTHVDDLGAMHQAIVTDVEGDYLELSFADGDEGYERALTCF